MSIGLGNAAAGTPRTLTVAITDFASDANPSASSWGRVTSNPPGIDCPSDCTESFPEGTTVDLTLQLTGGYALGEWSIFGTAASCATEPGCSVTIGPDDLTVEAALRPEAQLSVIPEGAGTITIDPVEAGRGSDPCQVVPPVFEPLPTPCTPRYPNGTRVKVSAVADSSVPGAHFVRWSDYRCGKRPSCAFTMQGDRYLSAFFTPAYLNVASGSFGPINVSPPGGDCSFADDPATGAETPCQFLFPLNTTVTLQRDPAQAQNSTDQWTGSCKGAGETCTFKIRKNEYVAAGADPTQDIPTRVGEGITLMRKGAKGGRIVLRPLSGTGRGLVCRKKKCSQGGYRRSDNVLIVAKGTRRVKFVRWGDSRWPSARRSLKVGDHNPVLAIFRRR